MIIRVYTRKSCNYPKFSYYDSLNKVYITPSELFEQKKNGATLEFQAAGGMGDDLLYHAMLNLVNFWTKKDLIKTERPELLTRIIKNGGYSEYLNELEPV